MDWSPTLNNRLGRIGEALGGDPSSPGWIRIVGIEVEAIARENPDAADPGGRKFDLRTKAEAHEIANRALRAARRARTEAARAIDEMERVMASMCSLAERGLIGLQTVRAFESRFADFLVKSGRLPESRDFSPVGAIAAMAASMVESGESTYADIYAAIEASRGDTGTERAEGVEFGGELLAAMTAATLTEIQ